MKYDDSPIFLEPIAKEKIWGGNNINKKFKRNCKGKIGESWEVCANDSGDCLIRGTNTTLSELFLKQRELFGEKMKNYQQFPIIIKYIDATDNLSVQVHPLKENKKDECWYILDCNEDSEIIYGLKENLTVKEVQTAIENKKLNQELCYIPIKKGDFIYIPSGTIHAILKNTLLIEIQQNSNVTYRIYDWNRKRKLNIEAAKDNLLISSQIKLKNYNHIEGECNLTRNQNFNVNKISIDGIYQGIVNQESCLFLNVISADNTKLKINNREYNIKTGDSIILPAMIKKFILEGEFEIVKTWL